MIHTFLPVTRQPPSTFLANVEMLVVSVPASGSVTANEVCRSPSTGAQQVALLQVLGAVVDDRLGPKMPMCTALQPPMPAPDAEISCSTIAASVTPSPPPPYSSGTGEAEPAALARRRRTPTGTRGWCRAPSSTRRERLAHRADGVADVLVDQVRRVVDHRRLALLRYARPLASAGGAVVGVGGAALVAQDGLADLLRRGLGEGVDDAEEPRDGERGDLAVAPAAGRPRGRPAR